MNEQLTNDEYHPNDEFPTTDEFETVLVSGGYQCLHKVTKIPYAYYLWKAMTTIEWRAASIVYQKYKKEYDFPVFVLDLLKMFNFKFTRTRKELGKDTNLDFLTQECVKEAKKIGELIKKDRQSKEE